MLAAVTASRADDTPRRVLADYWIDHGDTDRGMFRAREPGHRPSACELAEALEAFA